MHAGLLLTSSAVGEYIPIAPRRGVNIEGYEVRPLSVLIPEPFYLRKEPLPLLPAHGNNALHSTDAGRDVRRETQPEFRLTLAARGGAHAKLAEVELPRAESRLPQSPAILQPRQAPVIALEPLPMMLAWATAEAPVSTRRPLIIPGARDVTPTPLHLDAPPRIDVPNRELTHALLNIPPAAAAAEPALPVPPSSTVPLRVTNSSDVSPSSSASLDVFAADPANLIVLSPRTVDRKRVFAIPPGSNMPEGIASSAGIMGAGSRGAAQTNGDAAVSEARDGGAAASATNRQADVTQPWPHGATNGAGTEHFVSASADVAGAGETEKSQVSSEVIRRTYPAGGAFDVVIVQAAPERMFHPGSTLSGKPVYTVYLEVGTPKPWLLQFCVPSTDAPPPMSPVVNLADMQPVKAPYPLVTLIQPIVAAVTSGYDLIRGFITANGRFRDLKTIGGNGRAHRVLPLLEQWEFRPAMLGPTAIDVEILLAIPTPGA
jgi:hypothetical protein